MLNKTTAFIASTVALLVLGQPLVAAADSKGERASAKSSESRSESSNESRSGKSEPSQASRRESEGPGEHRSGPTEKKDYGLAKSARADDSNGHERGEGRRDWDEKRHLESTEQEARRQTMTPEAAALMTQVRKAAFEYRTTGSAESLAALQSLRSSLVAMGFTRMTDRILQTSSPTSSPTTGAASTSGVTVQ